jgi:hypothetical protein
MENYREPVRIYLSACGPGVQHLDRGYSAGVAFFESELDKIGTLSTYGQLVACTLLVGGRYQQLNRSHHLCRDITPGVKTAANWKKFH